MRSLTFLLLLLFLFSQSLQAQHLSAGLQTGVSFWQGNVSPSSDKKITTPIWEKEVFARYALKRHFAFELGFSSFRGQDSYLDCGLGAGDVASYYENRYYLLNLRVQYGFSCGHSKKLRNYAGILIAPGQFSSTSVNKYENLTTHEITTNKSTDNSLILHAGIEDRIQYDLTKHLQIHTLLSYKWGDLEHCFSVQLGGAWCF